MSITNQKPGNKEGGEKRRAVKVSDIPQEILGLLRRAQDFEITEHLIYKALADRIKDKKNAEVLRAIAEDEKRHSEYWSSYTQAEPKPDMAKVGRFLFIAKVFGLTFGLKLLEKNEDTAQIDYQAIVEHIPEGASVVADEARHEQSLLAMINEEKLQYIGSIVLGLNDALVELTGTLAGLSFALQNSRIIGFAGLITGIAASLSMASSDYLSSKSEGVPREKALRSALYTGSAYIVTVLLLVLPYLLGLHYLLSLGLTLAVVLLIIAGFNYYLAVAKDLSFKQRFFEMAGISLGVAALTFGIGWLVRTVFGIEI